MRATQLAERYIGCLLGTAVGDSIGLPAEGLTKRRLQRMYGEITGHRFLWGRGMVSDDTEHTLLTARSLLVTNGEVNAFTTYFAWRLRMWLLGAPAGIGFATLRALLRLWIGIPPERSGVFSAGNGSAMRSAILGVWTRDVTQLRALVRASTRLTHTDPKAEYGAVAVALAASLSAHATEAVTPRAYLAQLRETLGDTGAELVRLAEKAGAAVEAGLDTEQFARQLGLGKGISGYVYHTVPVVLHAWLSFPDDFRAGVDAVIRCGGDTDTTAAIVGGIIGARVGKDGIPAAWIDGLWEWPRDVAWMEQLGRALAGVSERSLPVFPPALLARNLLFLLVVLGHGFRRLLPPY